MNLDPSREAEAADVIDSAVIAFWRARRTESPGLPERLPEVWAFGATPEHADELLDLVLAGVKTGTASSLWDYDATSDPVPAVGDYSVILDGAGVARAVLVTTEIEIVPFDEVTAEHAYSEGEGDRSLEYWRAAHERYWRAYSENPRGFAADMPVICERFTLVYPERD